VGEAMNADDIQWDERGLVAAVAQDAITGELLMLAWMNREALGQTLQTGFAHFYSRSRKKLWKKGESSGNTLAVGDVRYDCDADALLVVVSPAGPACHTGKRSCFYRSMAGEEDEEDEGWGGAPAAIVDRIYKTLELRKSSTAGKSYTKSLLDGGIDKILGKIREEHEELAEELVAGNKDEIVHETADLLFHVLVGLVASDVEPTEVWAELSRRFGTGGHDEKAAR
jgi:phosphoribosyl-ATP pyrophosphohydrolase/phosphoribosyl-AMP cyclohydrolase